MCKGVGKTKYENKKYKKVQYDFIKGCTKSILEIRGSVVVVVSVLCLAQTQSIHRKVCEIETQTHNHNHNLQNGFTSNSSFDSHPVVNQLRSLMISNTTNKQQKGIADPVITQTYHECRSNIHNMSHKRAWVHTVPFDVKHWDVGMKSTKAASVILRLSILLISLRAADIVHALQAEDLWAWTWKGRNLNTSDTVRLFFFFFFLFIEKVSCCRLAHFNILLLVKEVGLGGK